MKRKSMVVRMKTWMMTFAMIAGMSVLGSTPVLAADSSVMGSNQYTAGVTGGAKLTTGNTYRFGGYSWVVAEQKAGLAVLQSTGVTHGPWPGFSMEKFGKGSSYKSNIDGQDISGYDSKTSSLYSRIKDAEKSASYGKGLYLVSAAKLGATAEGSVASGAYRAPYLIAAKKSDYAWLGTYRKTSGGSYNRDYNGAYVITSYGQVYGDVSKIWSTPYFQNMSEAIAPAFNLDTSKVTLSGEELSVAKFSNSTGIHAIQSVSSLKAGQTKNLGQIITGVKYVGGTNDGRSASYRISADVGTVNGVNWMIPSSNTAKTATLTITETGSGKNLSTKKNVSITPDVGDLRVTQGMALVEEGASVPLSSLFSSVKYSNQANADYTVTVKTPGGGTVNGSVYVAPTGLNRTMPVSLEVKDSAYHLSAEAKITVVPRAAKEIHVTMKNDWNSSMTEGTTVDLASLIDVVGIDSGNQSDGKIESYTLSAEQGALEGTRYTAAQNLNEPETVTITVNSQGNAGEVSYDGKSTSFRIEILPDPNGANQKAKEGFIRNYGSYEAAAKTLTEYENRIRELENALESMGADSIETLTKELTSCKAQFQELVKQLSAYSEKNKPDSTGFLGTAEDENGHLNRVVFIEGTPEAYETTDVTDQEGDTVYHAYPNPESGEKDGDFYFTVKEDGIHRTDAEGHGVKEDGSPVLDGENGAVYSTSLETLQKQLNVQIEELKSRLEQCDAGVEKLRKELRESGIDVEQMEGDTDFEKIAHAIHTLSEELDDARKNAAEYQDALNSVHQALTRDDLTESDTKNLTDTLNEINQEISALRESIASAEKNAENVKKELERSDGDVTELKSRLEEKEQALGELKKTLEELLRLSDQYLLTAGGANSMFHLGLAEDASKEEIEAAVRDYVKRKMEADNTMDAIRALIGTSVTGDDLVKAVSNALKERGGAEKSEKNKTYQKGYDDGYRDGRRHSDSDSDSSSGSESGYRDAYNRGYRDGAANADRMNAEKNRMNGNEAQEKTTEIPSETSGAAAESSGSASDLTAEAVADSLSVEAASDLRTASAEGKHIRSDELSETGLDNGNRYEFKRKLTDGSTDKAGDGSTDEFMDASSDDGEIFSENERTDVEPEIFGNGNTPLPMSGNDAQTEEKTTGELSAEEPRNPVFFIVGILITAALGALGWIGFRKHRSARNGRR